MRVIFGTSTVGPPGNFSRNHEDLMIKIGTPVSYDGGQGIVDRTSIKTGVRLYRVNDRWFAKDGLTLLG